MVNPEIIKLGARAIIDYLDGHTEEFNRLTKIAMVINNQISCCCGGKKIPCLYGGKGNKVEAEICTRCGQVFIDKTKHGYKHGKLIVWRDRAC